eukprot:259425-Rhodomonas_salina.4
MWRMSYECVPSAQSSAVHSSLPSLAVVMPGGHSRQSVAPRPSVKNPAIHAHPKPSASRQQPCRYRITNLQAPMRSPLCGTVAQLCDTVWTQTHDADGVRHAGSSTQMRLCRVLVWPSEGCWSYLWSMARIARGL